MPITIACANCEKTLKIPDEMAGKKVRCPACKSVIAVPVVDDEDAAIEEDAPPPKMKPAGDAIKKDAPPPVRKRRPPDDEEDEVIDDEDGDEDEQEDEDDERRVKQLKRKKKTAYARSRVAGPALAIMICAGLSCAALIVYCPYNLYVVLSNPAFQNVPQETKVGQYIGAGVLVPMAAIFNLMAAIGAYHMKNLRKYQMARSSALISLIPCCGPFIVLGIPFGIWALIVLGDPKVKSAFSS